MFHKVIAAELGEKVRVSREGREKREGKNGKGKGRRDSDIFLFYLFLLVRF